MSVGLFAAAGALARLPRRLPLGVAMEMALTGQPIDAGRALELGLVARIAPPGQTLHAAVELAEQIAKNAPLALVASKHLVKLGGTVSEDEFWDLQAPLFKGVFSSADAMEGARAFVEKRPPKWRGV